MVTMPARNAFVTKLVAWASLWLLTFPAFALAQNPGVSLPKAALFVGLGGSYDSVNVKQDFDGTAVSNVYSGGVLVAYGNAGGPADPFQDAQSSTSHGYTTTGTANLSVADRITSQSVAVSINNAF